MHDKKLLIGEACLLGAAILWGFSWVFQRFGADEIPGFTFVTVRCAFAALALGAVVLFRRARGKGNGRFILSRTAPDGTRVDRRTFAMPIVFVGLSAFGYVLGIYCQQVALLHLAVGTTAFITAAYVVVLPFVEVIMLKAQVARTVWIGVVLAFVGLYFLSVSSGFQIDVWCLVALAGAMCWVVQVVAIDRALTYVQDNVDVTFLLFLLCMIFGAVGMLVFEGIPDFNAVGRALGSLLYCGLIGGALAFGLQIYGQKSTPPSLAGIMLSTEGVFAPISAFLVMGEVMSPREIFGGILMLLGVVVSQIPARKPKGGTDGKAD